MPDEPKADSKNQIRAVPLEDVRRARGEAKMAMPRSKVASLRAFRRVRADRTFGAIGILLLFVGLALIFAWEKPPEVEKKFGVEWPQSTIREPPISGARLAEGAAAQTHSYKLTVPNATAIVFSLVWKDDVGDKPIEGDRLEMKIEGPPGITLVNATLNDTGDGKTGGNITFPVALNGIPDIASVNADTNESAFQAVGDRTNETGIGDWKISVRVLSAPGNYANEGNANPDLCRPGTPTTPYCTPDGGQAYEVHVSYTTYSLRLKKLF